MTSHPDRRGHPEHGDESESDVDNENNTAWRKWVDEEDEAREAADEMQQSLRSK